MPMQYEQEQSMISEPDSAINCSHNNEKVASQSVEILPNQNEVNHQHIMEETNNAAAMKKPNLRIHTQIDDNFQIQSGENTIIENSTDDGQNTLENFQYGYVASKEDGRTNMNQQVLIED